MSRVLKTIVRWALLMALGLFPLVLRAERYLTIEDAQRLCFPGADQFEEQIIRFTPEQTKAIEKESGVRVRNLGNRLWIARQGSNVAGVVFLDFVTGKHERIDYVVALSPAGTVQQIEILEYRESYGGEIRGRKWREQFQDKTHGSALRLNDDIYNISGATMSCRNVTEGVKRVLSTYEIVVRPRLVAAGRLPKSAEG